MKNRVVIAILSCVVALLAVCMVKLNNKTDELNGKLVYYSQSIESLNAQLDVYKDTDYGIEAHGSLSVKGTKLVDESGEEVYLKGMSTHGMSWYPRYTNASAVRELKKQGANVIRLAVYSDQNDSYLYEKEENMNYLYMAIENALSENMYVIVDWHVLRDETPLLHMDNAKEFFEEVSSHYGNNKGIIYEICNEPCGDTTWNDIKEYAKEVIPIIRENAEDSVIIVGTPGNSFDVEEVLGQTLDFRNIMYAFHVYIDVTDKDVEGMRWLERKLDVRLPIIVTEWGISDDDNTGATLYEDKALEFVQMMKDRNISWCNWSLSNKDEVYSMFKPDCNKYSGWTMDDLTFSGKMIIKALNK